MIYYDIQNLQKFLNELSPQERKKLFQSGIRRVAEKVRKAAVANLRESGMNLDPGSKLEKGIKKKLYRKVPGFRVTIGTQQEVAAYKRSRGGYHRYGKKRRTWTGFTLQETSKGKKLPILIWAEGGTARRFTKRRFFSKKGSGHSTGQMPAYGFMKKTHDEKMPGIEAEVKQTIIDTVHRKAKKYGGK